MTFFQHIDEIETKLRSLRFGESLCVPTADSILCDTVWRIDDGFLRIDTTGDDDAVSLGVFFSDALNDPDDEHRWIAQFWHYDEELNQQSPNVRFGTREEAEEFIRQTLWEYDLDLDTHI